MLRTQAYCRHGGTIAQLSGVADWRAARDTVMVPSLSLPRTLQPGSNCGDRMTSPQSLPEYPRRECQLREEWSASP